LMGVMEGILEAYLSERGWFGTHRCTFPLPPSASNDCESS
jgi:hypothetical protein